MPIITRQIASVNDDRIIMGTDRTAPTWNSSTYDYGWLGAYDASSNVGVMLRFLDIQIPQGAIITDARLEYHGYDSQRITPPIGTTEITALDQDDAWEAPVVAQLVNPTTTAYVEWSGLGLTAADTPYQSPDVSPVIQELVDRTGWASGNNITMLHWWPMPYVSGTSREGIWFYQGSTTMCPSLIIEYVTIPTPILTATQNGSAIDLTWAY